MSTKKLVAATLTVSLSLGALPARAQDQTRVVDRPAMEQALASRIQSDEAARESIRALLGRDEVKAMAGGMGLDVRRATSAVSSLSGGDLQRLASQAAAADALLSGGASGTIQISVVTLLLIIIIVILLAD